MARLITSGFDKLEEDLYKIEGNIDKLAVAMVQQGAELMAQQRAATARAYGHIKTGEMISSIGYAKKPRTIAGVVRNDVFARGKDNDGTRNAEKEYLLHYGWSNYDGDHWVDEADQLGSEIAYDKMSAMMDRYIETGEVPKVEVKQKRR